MEQPQAQPLNQSAPRFSLRAGWRTRRESLLTFGRSAWKGSFSWSWRLSSFPRRTCRITTAFTTSSWRT
ncbi:MAG: hypothetical protein MUE67_10995 [Anaerolineales bacterium]|nr:hypothetical protein [Anaerolineales bacterium]